MEECKPSTIQVLIPGLAKALEHQIRTVQLIVSQLRARFLQTRNPAWSTFVPDIAISINTRLIRIHGFTPTQLMLGYQPTLDRTLQPATQSTNGSPSQGDALHLACLHQDTQWELQELAAMGYMDHTSCMARIKNPIWSKPQVVIWS
ncbi:hypothetical protein L228DRAFT_274586 [Xylona heveae TC161]|uniref:Uncharacterized protein n=1 Tax=Xylona heveae (strain CBS 132557 / TC161) TaxID=1328760 RepID=A0A165IM50_XYLHT|nr:hypothetical protein L228DRAFT_274586 [Xylona heveae TC161]KZF25094.1 hypothetical protein L228DRAFT_274586 [Xylona heveae TC161]